MKIPKAQASESFRLGEQVRCWEGRDTWRGHGSSTPSHTPCPTRLFHLAIHLYLVSYPFILPVSISVSLNSVSHFSKLPNLTLMSSQSGTHLRLVSEVGREQSFSA